MLKLSFAETRVLGCLIEKQVTVPDSYPLTLNSLRIACNQSTSRDPVVEFADHDVESALGSLREQQLTRTVHSTSNRAIKYRHVVDDQLGLDAAELAVLSVLLLRGPQTVGELKQRTARQYEFDSTDHTEATLTALAARDEPLVVQLERQPGQKDARWMHLLSGQPVATDNPTTAPISDSGAPVTQPLSVDAYGEGTAEFYDLLKVVEWESLGNELLGLLAPVDPAAGPIADIGAGTGGGLAAIRVAVPDANIFAVEPSRAMRTALHQRIAADPELITRVTVERRNAGAAIFPSQLSGAVLSSVIGHLDDSERDVMFSALADRLPSGAPLVIGLVPPAEPVTVPRQRFANVTVGTQRYEGWQAGTPLNDTTMKWAIEYRVLDAADDTVLDEITVEASWRCDKAADIIATGAGYGFTVGQTTDHFIQLLRR